GAICTFGRYDVGQKIDFLKASVSPKKFTDGLPKLGAHYVGQQIQIALEGSMQDLSADNIAKAVDKLGNGKYLIVAFEKTYTKGYWASVALVGGKGAWTVFAPYNGQFKTAKSAEIAPALMEHMKGRNFAKKVDAFVVLKCSHTPGDIITPRFAKAATDTHNALVTFTTEALNDEVAKNWFAKDFTRFADHCQVSKDGKVLKAQLTDMKAHDVLKLIVTNMGSTWEVPADTGKTYDAATGGPPLKEHVAKTMKAGDELYRVFVLTTQNKLTNYFDALLRGAKIGSGQVGQVVASTTDPRIKNLDAERWWFHLEIAPTKVTVTHHVTFVSKPDSGVPSPFVVRIAVKREHEKATKKVTCSPTQVAVTLG
ncbi:MAG: hypothetical protein ACAI25_13395, partial [Planctomycetota bacterium]